VSYKQIPTVASKKRIQALDTEDTALSASTADYEFHPNAELTDQADSTAPNPVCNLQGRNHLEGF